MLFRRLSVFAGSFDLPAVEAVAADDELPLDELNSLLGDLVDRSMVAVESGPHGRRFRLLETMRQFAAEHLAEAGASDRMAERHARFVRTEVERLGQMLMSNDEIEGAARLVELWPNLRAAIDWALAVGDADLTCELLQPIALQMFVRRGLGEIADWAERLLEITPPDDEEMIAHGLMWAAMHYSMTQEREQYLRLVEEHGASDHLLVRYAHLLVVEDNDFAALELGPQVIAEMQRRGHHSYARLFEMFTAAALLSAGRFDEARVRHEALADELRAGGPPSFLNWTLYLLGASAAFQGDLELADRYWEESIATEVPPRTNSPNEVLSARAAFRKGRQREAFRILGAYVDKLVEVDNMAGVAMVGLEFINIMAAIDRLSDAAVVLGHFDATGLLGIEGPGFKLLIEDAVEVVATDPEAMAARENAAADAMDEVEALAHMRRVLLELAEAGDE